VKGGSQTYQSPIGHNTGNLDGSILTRASDEILNGSSVEELDVGELQDLAEKGAGEESSMLDNDIVAVITIFLVLDTDLAEESISRLAHDHGREELATEPSTTTRADAGFDDGNLQVRASLGQAVSGRETTGTGTDDDNIRLGILVKI